MLPSLSPNSRSRSSGVSTCRCSTWSRMSGHVLGQRVEDGVAERVPPRVVPDVVAGERVGRVLHEARHHVLSRAAPPSDRRGSGSRCPCTAAPTARRTSRRRRPARDTRCSARSRSRRRGAARAPAGSGSPGSASSARLTLAVAPRKRKPRTEAGELGGQLLEADQPRERHPQVRARRHRLGADLLARFQDDADRASRRRRGSARPATTSAASRPASRRRGGDRHRDRARCRRAAAPTSGRRRRSRPCSGAAARRPCPASGCRGTCR